MADDIIQRSPEWLAIKAGRVGASRVADAIRKLKNGSYATSRLTLMCELIAESYTGTTTPIGSGGFVPRDVQRGIDSEPLARKLYEDITGSLVLEAGFVFHPKIERSGCSPDGYVGNAGLVEFKAPRPENHIRTMVTHEIDNDYILQCQWQMACTGRQWVDFASFSPALPKEVCIYISRIERDDKLIASMEIEVVKFLEDMDNAQQKMLLDCAKTMEMMNG